ncbi:MAG: PAS domain S-box protein, partial [Halohasta sp.]
TERLPTRILERYSNTLVVGNHLYTMDVVFGGAIRGVYVVAFLGAAVTCFSAIAGSRGIDHPDVRRGLSSLLVLSGVWSLLTTLQLLVDSRLAAVLLEQGGLIAGVTTVFAWLAFASAYAGYQYHRRRSLQLAAVGVLGAIIAVKLTNPLHGLYFTVARTTEPFPHWMVEYGAIHWFVSGFAYTAAVVGFVWLFDSFERGDSRPTPLYALVVVTALPLVPAVLSEYSTLLLTINYEPLGVAVFAVGILFYARTEFANHSSPGQTILADSLSGGGLVLDESGIVIDANSQAARILGMSTVPRVPIAEVDAELAAIEPGETALRQYTVEGRQRRYEVERSPVEESLIAAEILTFTDVTRTLRLESLVGLYRELTEALVEGTDPAALIGRIPESVAEIDAYELVWLYPADETDGERAGRQSAGRRPDGETAVLGRAAGEATGYAVWASAAASTAEPVVEAAAQDEQRHATVDGPDAAWRGQAADYGFTECVAVPMAFDDERYVLGVYTAAPEGFAAAELEILAELGDRIPQAVDAIETHEQAHQYEEAITHAGVAISITDADGVIQYVNPAFEQLTGYPAEEAVGSTHRILKSGEMTEAHYEELWGTITEGGIFKERAINRSKDGDRYILQQTISPVIGPDGEPEAYVAIQFDITDKILREQRLSVLNRVLRHNLRTSVNVIAGNTTVLEDRLQQREPDGELPASLAEPLAAIRRRVEHIDSQSAAAREIEHVLADEETGRSWVDVETVVSAAAETAATHGAELDVEVGETMCDQRVDVELVEIAEELVENAIIHHESEPSAIDLRLSIGRSGDDLTLSVADDGPGLSEQELVVVEDGDEAPLRHGSGLGLWKVNWLAISCGGSISATTDETGTTIRVQLPLRGNRPMVTDAE